MSLAAPRPLAAGAALPGRVGLRDRVVIDVIVDHFARVAVALGMRGGFGSGPFP